MLFQINEFFNYLLSLIIFYSSWHVIWRLECFINLASDGRSWWINNPLDSLIYPGRNLKFCYLGSIKKVIVKKLILLPKMELHKKFSVSFINWNCLWKSKLMSTCNIRHQKTFSTVTSVKKSVKSEFHYQLL